LSRTSIADEIRIEHKLVRAFGEKVFDVIEATPDRLREVDAPAPDSRRLCRLL